MNVKKSNVLGIIPARFNSSRLEGKPLALIAGKPMIQHVYQRAQEILEHVIVATDDKRIANCVKSFGGEVEMTRQDHENGTNRCLEAYESWHNKKNLTPKIIINIQGDEPLLNKNHIEQLISCFNDKETTIATLGLELEKGSKLESGKVYLVKDSLGFALYFSRHPIPFLRDIDQNKWTNHHAYLQHIGLYAFTVNSLTKFCSLNSSVLEKFEKLEQLRWLENGGKIKVAITKKFSQPVDTIDDLNKVRELFKLKGN